MKFKKLTKNSPITFVELPPTQFGILNGNLGYDIYSKFNLPSRAIPTLRAVLIRDGWVNTKEINPYYHGGKGKLTHKNIKDIFDSDVLLISSITRTAPQSMKLADKYREVNPGGIIIAGGPEPTFNLEEWLKHVDIIVVGEGEKTLKRLMNRIIKNPSKLSDIKGIAFKKNNKIVTTKKRELLTEEELSKLPHPFYDKEMKKNLGTGAIETTRGCPHNCDYCGVTLMYGNKYRRKSTEWILDELKRINDIGAGTFFVDDNLTPGGSIEVEKLKTIATKAPYKKHRITQVTVNASKNDELLKALKKAGITTLCVGIESLSDDTLKDLGKPFRAKQNMEAIKKFRKAGFFVHGMMMLGGDGDTPESLKNTSKWINKNLDTVQLFTPVPLPGTRFHKRMKEEKRILTEKKYLYDAQHVLIKPKNFSPYELQITINKMYEKFYSIKNLFPRILTTSKKSLILLLTLFSFSGSLKKLLNNPQSKAHLKFLKSIS